MNSEAHGSSTEDVGVVVIGRNEGDRLRACLRSVCGSARRAVYVDSGSTDGSVEFARSIGVDVLELDMTLPFTMARGRNAGFERLLREDPTIRFVQFVDGDCEVRPGWIERARTELLRRPDVVAVFGRRRERHPEASLYNRLTDQEWEGPAGEVEQCGGDVMMRARSLRSVGGYNEKMIAGEEPELSVRLRQAGGVILRLDAEMTLHDAAITRFSQWWRRTVRTGHAYAEGAELHGRTAERHKVRHVLSALLWGLAVPVAALGLMIAAIPGPGWCAGVALGLILLYPWLWLRVYRGRRNRCDRRSDAAWHALFCVLAKFAHVGGILRYAINRLGRRRSALIEYKTPETTAAQRGASRS